MRLFTFITALTCTMFYSCATFSVERIEMEGTSIIGNKEQPNILYILPWRTADLPEMVELPLSSLINDALQPIDRETVLRQQKYQQIINQHKTSLTNTEKEN